jgi:2-polyprenyl-3-methyl-5-hydroxy-6-metoxy-1,4-benzoquinol methylase
MSTNTNIAKIKTDDQRFQRDADKYAAYLETAEGRLRIDLGFANLQDCLSLRQTTRSLRALDIGGGTGALSERLARVGFDVVLLDSSVSMLEIAKRSAEKAGVAAKIELKHGEAEQLAKLFPAKSFDVVLCHNILEFVENPIDVLRDAAGLLRDSSAILSILVRNQAGEVLKAAIQNGDLAAAEHNLNAECGNESLYGGKVRLFARHTLQNMLASLSLTIVADRGVRVISDYLAPQVPREAEYDRILELERKLGCRPEFAAVARYTHLIARSGQAVATGRT